MSRSGASLICFFLILYCHVGANAQAFNQTITSTDSRQVTVVLEYFPIRTSNFGVLIQQGDGSFSSYNAPAPRTYLGTVQGFRGAMASALLKPNGTLLCRISFEDGSEWSTTGGSPAKVSESSWRPRWPTTVVPATTANSTIYVAEVGVDASYAQYVASGSNTDDTIDMVEYAMLSANVPFLRDASILHKVGKLVIRRSSSRDPYPSTDTEVLLNKVRDLWNGELAATVGKTHHVGMVTRPGAGGGLAWVGTLGTSNSYSANGADKNGDFTVIWRHELGHNWGSEHYEGGGRPEGPTIMSDNALSRFSSSELLTILNHKAKVPLLANASLVISRPPRANMDAVTISNRQPLSINVLGNDLDADFRGLKVSSVPSPSPVGSTVQISGNQILYTPSVASAVSGDSFSYTIQNAQGKTATGYVILTPDALVGWWKLDETSGNTPIDSSRKAATGNITSGTATWDQGLVFRGATTVSLTTSPSLSGTTSFSLSLWVKVPSGSGSSNAILIQQRSPPSSNTDGFNGEYRVYLRDGARPSVMVFGDGDSQFDFSTSTGVNDGQWHHVVAVRDGREGRIYVDGNLTATASGQLKNLDGNIPVFLGSDTRDNAAFLTGTLSGVRIYSRALSSEEISHLSTCPEALFAWWEMAERSGQILRDSSGNGATGTITGSTSWDQNGGLTFQGAGKVSFGTRPSLGGQTSFSIHAWVKVPTTAGSSTGVIIQQRSPGSSGFNGEYQLYLRDGSRPSLMVYGDNRLQFDFSTSAGIKDGQWHHIIALRDGTEGRIYIDGKLSASASGPLVNLDGKISVSVGWDARDDGAFLTASVRDVKIYNLPLVK